MLKVLVLGVGNPTLGDDALGLYVARELREEISRKKLKIEVVIEESSLDWLTIAEKMVDYDKVILIDTAVVNEEKLVGRIFKFDLKGSDERYEYSYTLHNLSLQSAIKIIRRLSPEETPEKVILILIGIIEPKEFSNRLSPKIKRIIPRVVKEVLDEISKIN